MPINKQLPGRILFTCSKCGKQIWLAPEILAIAYQGGVCLDCKQMKEPP